jgi:hypothetical protein
MSSYFQSKGIRYLSGILKWNSVKRCCICGEFPKDEALKSVYIPHLDDYIHYHEECYSDYNIEKLLIEFGLEDA